MHIFSIFFAERNNCHCNTPTIVFFPCSHLSIHFMYHHSIHVYNLPLLSILNIKVNNKMFLKYYGSIKRLRGLREDVLQSVLQNSSSALVNTVGTDGFMYAHAGGHLSSTGLNSALASGSLLFSQSFLPKQRFICQWGSFLYDEQNALSGLCYKYQSRPRSLQAYSRPAVKVWLLIFLCASRQISYREEANENCCELQISCSAGHQKLKMTEWGC